MIYSSLVAASTVSLGLPAERGHLDINRTGRLVQFSLRPVTHAETIWPESTFRTGPRLRTGLNQQRYTQTDNDQFRARGDRAPDPVNRGDKWLASRSAGPGHGRLRRVPIRASARGRGADSEHGREGHFLAGKSKLRSLIPGRRVGVLPGGWREWIWAAASAKQGRSKRSSG
jgi:hypothetical protein